MLDPALIALTSAAGTAVASAAGTDAWAGFRTRVARIFGRGHAAPEQAVLERLDQAAADIDGADAEGAELVRAGVVTSWRTRFQDLLEDLDTAERVAVADQLRELVTLAQSGAGGITAGDGEISVGGSVELRADHGSAVAWTMGDVHFGNPSTPGPDNG